MNKELLDRTDVIDEVKPILSIDNCGFYSIQQLAEYFDVKPNTIQKNIQRHIKEFEQDASRMVSREEAIKFFKDVNLEENRYFTDVICRKNHIRIRIGNNGVKLLSKKSIIRLAFLLNHSEVATKICEKVKEPKTRKIEQVHTDPNTTYEKSEESNEVILKKLENAYANLGYAIVNKQFDFIPMYIEDVKNLEGYNPNQEQLVEDLNKEIEDLKAQLKQKDEDLNLVRDKMIAGILIVIMKEMNITPLEMVKIMERILPKQY